MSEPAVKLIQETPTRTRVQRGGSPLGWVVRNPPHPTWCFERGPYRSCGHACLDAAVDALLRYVKLSAEVDRQRQRNRNHIKQGGTP